MRNLLLIVMFVPLSAAAQEFMSDAEAAGRLVAQARVLRVKHDGRPLPPMVLDYDARLIGFRLRRNGAGRDEEGVYVNKTLEILYMDSPLAALELNDDPRGWPAAERLLQAFESLRRDAVAQGRRIVLDYDAIHRQNAARAWSQARNPRECALFDEVIRLGPPRAGR